MEGKIPIELSSQQSVALTVEQALLQALTHHKQGQLQDAERLYRAILLVQPSQPDVNHNLGILTMQLGQPVAALPYFKTALEANQNQGQFWLSYINALIQAGSTDEARKVLELGLQRGLNGEAVEALVERLGGTAQVSGLSNAENRHELPSSSSISTENSKKNSKAKPAKLKKFASKPVLHKGKNPGPKEINNLVALFAKARYKEAEMLAQDMTVRFPQHGLGWGVLGAVFKQSGRFYDALAPMQKAAALSPSDPNMHSNLAALLQELGRFDEAEASCKQALMLKSNFAEAHFNLGNILNELERPEEAEASYRRALKIKPDFAVAHSNLGTLLNKLGRQQEAEASCRCALQIMPDFADAHCNLGHILQELGQLNDAVSSYRQAIAIKPDFAKARSNLLLILNHLPNQSQASMLDEARRFGDMAVRQANPYTDWRNVPDPDRCLRVGLVSGDLRNHPIGYFVEGVLAALASDASSRLQIIAYPSHFQSDELTQRIKSYCSAWRPAIGMSDERLARQVRDDDIDILIDLSGHTAHNRLPMFAWRPAPVQVSWLGYFATTGVPGIDYLLGDRYVTPTDEASYFAEKLWQLPETYLCFTAPDVNLEVSSLPALSTGKITFGCFNNLTKMNDAVIEVWAKILTALPESKLFLKTRQLNEALVREATFRNFAKHNIRADRLILENASPRAELLAAYHRVDIALDPFPYPGGTTSVEGLWMGVPVITKRGDRFISHVGETIAHNARLSDWVAADADDYVAKAVSHASDIEQLAKLRARLRQQVLASPLFDATRFARHFEEAMWKMWQIWQDKKGES